MKIIPQTASAIYVFIIIFRRKKNALKIKISRYHGTQKTVKLQWRGQTREVKAKDRHNEDVSGQLLLCMIREFRGQDCKTQIWTEDGQRRIPWNGKWLHDPLGLVR